MKEIEDGILLVLVGLVAVRSIHSEPAVHTQDLAGVPGVAHGAVLCGLAVVFRALAGNQEHRKVTGTITLYKDVLGVVHRHTVNYKIVGVDLRRRKGNLDFPYVVLTAEHVDGATPGVGHPATAELHDGSVVCLEAEGYAVVLDFRGNDGFAVAPESEVCEFLCIHCAC